MIGFVDTAAQNDLAIVADTFEWAVVVGIVAQTERLMLADTAEWAENAETVDTAVLGIVGCADTADAADSVGLLHWFGLDSIVEAVDDAEAAVGTADTVAATEWQPSSTTMREYLALVPTENRDLTSDHEDVYKYKELMGRDLAFPKNTDGLVP